jgi:hypothetical protein
LTWPDAGNARRRDLPAHQLGRLIVDAVLGAPSGFPLEMTDVATQPDRDACLVLR